MRSRGRPPSPFDYDRLMSFIQEEVGLSFDEDALNMKALCEHMGCKPWKVRRAFRYLRHHKVLMREDKRHPRRVRWHVIARVAA